MTKKCIYCGKEISDDCVIDFCDACGEKVWGKKMFAYIKQNMENARDTGNLCHMNNTCQFEKEREIN
jgi:hypothetical protein